MNENSLWMRFFVWRTFLYAIAGAMWGSFFGAILVAGCGAVTGWITVRLQAPGYFNVIVEEVVVSTLIGLILGGAGGGIGGAVCLGVIGISNPPDRSYFPSKFILVGMVKGMAAATFGVTASLLVLSGVLHVVHPAPLLGKVNEAFAIVFLFGPPLVMLCGLVWGCTSSLRHQKLQVNGLRIET